MNELFNILKNIEINLYKNKNLNCYKNYEPSIIIKKFDEICLQKKQKKTFSIEEFIRDLPWELIIILKNILKIIKIILIKIIPPKLKIFLKKKFFY